MPLWYATSSDTVFSDNKSAAGGWGRPGEDAGGLCCPEVLVPDSGLGLRGESCGMRWRWGGVVWGVWITASLFLVPPPLRWGVVLPLLLALLSYAQDVLGACAEGACVSVGEWFLCVGDVVWAVGGWVLVAV